MAKKKATKKKAVKRAAPKEMKSEDEVLVDDVDNMSDEEVDHIIEAPDYKAPAPVEGASKGPMTDANMMEEVSIRIPITLKLKRKVYSPGVHKVPRHMVATILEIVDKKRKADLSIFTGKNYLIERLLDRTLIVKESSGEIDLKKIVK
jgi:hypothetical protein